MVRITVHIPRMQRALRRARYLVITMKGLRFIEKWYTADHIPSHLTRIYQLLLRLIWMKGTMAAIRARRLGDNKDVLKLASSKGYVEIHNRPHKPSEAIQNKIFNMIGEAPRWIYA